MTHALGGESKRAGEQDRQTNRQKDRGAEQRGREGERRERAASVAS